jgi:hypothetical protein
VVARNRMGMVQQKNTYWMQETGWSCVLDEAEHMKLNSCLLKINTLRNKERSIHERTLQKFIR